MAATFRSVVLDQPELAAIVFAFQFGLYDDVRPAFAACKELVDGSEGSSNRLDQDHGSTFPSVVLGQPEIASIVFEFQFGVYEDMRPAFRACNELLEFDTTKCIYNRRIVFQLVCAKCRVASRDARLPLHLAIGQGFVHLTKRMLRCRPDLASEDAILLAFWKDRLKIADLLLREREDVPELYRYSNCNDRRRLYSRCLPAILSRPDSKALALFHRFDPSPEEITRYVRLNAVQHATLDNVTLALDLLPWLHDEATLDIVAGQGLLPVVRTLYMNVASRARWGCTLEAMDQAAANGHLEVVRFLHYNRTEGCTVDALDGAILNGHLDIVHFLIEQRTEGASPNILDRAAANGHLGVVKYLHFLGSLGCTVAAVNKAAAGGPLEVVQCLFTHRTEGCSRDDVVKKALRGGHLRTAEYLLSLGYPLPATEIYWSLDGFELITPELANQAKLAGDSIQLAPSVVGRAATVLADGDVLEWALAVVIGHCWATDATAATVVLQSKITLVHDQELRAQLNHLLSGSRPFTTDVLQKETTAMAQNAEPNVQLTRLVVSKR
ncbi:hypothetical protein SPRG_06448 [Saprolegnia parasitica CBS 223.65]|uniref:Uncharacterized protein n=1 Tax=Saprolegnia parasitica (strain CBS 223.65) TaxID=695850 RepID=A0A067CP57_SAPPC|nr:hypothetical protein SPRG_06448 [Saprolegnia parasitica CBS 223.65]KDO28592.1 hypothetical protein SPRG_06448 [Saprolegnia parasitica CBS 223.65]|eukprot:XP_012200655.1 hypothetical protein SPRG_06448 [Saprolegnia parasitica CBS 223.65]